MKYKIFVNNELYCETNWQPEAEESLRKASAANDPQSVRLTRGGVTYGFGLTISDISQYR